MNVYHRSKVLVIVNKKTCPSEFKVFLGESERRSNICDKFDNHQLDSAKDQNVSKRNQAGRLNIPLTF